MKKPIDDFNACDDFFMTVLTSHIITAALKYLQMDSLSEGLSDSVLPHSADMWMGSKEQRKEVLDQISLKIIEEFVDFNFTGVTAKRHAGKTGDGIEVYAKDVLSMGLFYWEYSDSIREGDGKRLFRCWMYMLPMYINTGRKNYSIEALRLLYQHDYQLPPRQATQLLYSRFINTRGLPGHNIGADLHMEHLNKTGKGCVRNLGANKTETAIQRSAKALGTIVPVLEKFDEQNNVPDISGEHKRASTEKDRTIIVQELRKNKVFDTVPGRYHPSFPHPKNALRSKNTDELKTWIVDRI